VFYLIPLCGGVAGVSLTGWSVFFLFLYYTKNDLHLQQKSTPKGGLLF